MTKKVTPVKGTDETDADYAADVADEKAKEDGECAKDDCNAIATVRDIADSSKVYCDAHRPKR